MVKSKIKEGVEYYICEACGMAYLTKDIAKKCEIFCLENKSCNLDLIKHSVKIV